MSKRRTFELKVEPDPCPELEVEDVGSWVPAEKHTRLAKYLGATSRARIKFPKRVFIDPFCGPGRIRVKDEIATRDGGALVAWRQSVAGGAAFTQVLVGDIDPNRAVACEARLSALKAPVERITGAAADTVKQMVARVPARALTLAYVDPYNLEALSFDIIRKLAELKNVDLLIHFSRMDLQRNVDLELDDSRARFDEAAPGWRAALKGLSKAQLASAFFEYWQSEVKKLGFTVSEEMPLVRAENGAPLYRLVFFSRHPFPMRIWDDVAKGPNRELFD